MLLLHPQSVFLDDDQLPDVRAVAIDRVATKVAEEWDDAGPNCVFADAPEQRVTVRIVQDLVRGSLGGKTPPDSPPRPGEKRFMRLITAPGSTDAGRQELYVTIVVTGVKHDLTTGNGATRTITGVAVSGTGDEDPVTVESL